MMQWKRAGIGTKLAVAFAVGLTFAVILLTHIFTHSLEDFGEFSAVKNEANIRNQSYYFLSTLTQEQAERYEVIFQQLSALTHLIAEQAQSYLDHDDFYGKTNLNPQEKLTFYTDKEIFANSPGDRIAVSYWDKPRVSATVTTQINALSHIDPLLEQAQRANPSAIASWVLLDSSVIRYYPNSPLIDALPPKRDGDIRDGVYYTIATPANNPDRKAQWTKVYQDPAGNGLMTSITTPIYSESQQFLGVAAIDITLNNIVSEILGIAHQTKTQSRTLKGEFSFLIDQTGNIIALPLNQLTLLGVDPPSNTIHPNQLLDYNLLDSRDATVRSVVQQMIAGKQQITGLSLNNETYLISSHPIASTGWSLGIVVPEASLLSSVQVTRNALNATVERLTQQLSLTTIGLLIGSVIVISLIARQIVRPVNLLTQEVSRIQMIDSTDDFIKQLEDIHPEAIVTTTQEVADLQEAFIQMKNSLMSNWKQLKTETAENVRLSAELMITQKLQQMLLPKPIELNQVNGLDIAGFIEPADEVGGDYYDVLQFNGRVKIGIGDVTGHGLESGLMMMMVQMAVRTLLTHQETDPLRFLNTINRSMHDNIQRMQIQKNMTLSLLDYDSGVLQLTGQHEEVIIIRANGEIERLDTLELGIPIGLEADISTFAQASTITLSQGDVVILYTDGITEAWNDERQSYGLERLCQVAQTHGHATSGDICQAVISDLRTHTGDRTLDDDITLLVLKQL